MAMSSAQSSISPLGNAKRLSTTHEKLFLRVLGTILILSAWSSAQQPAPQRAPFPAAQQIKIAQEVESHSELKSLAAKGRLRALSVRPHLPEKGEPLTPANLASVILFSYGEGGAYRVLYDPAAHRILKREPLPGRPQPSPEEIREARGLIRKDADHARLLSAGYVLEGGFAVDGPPGTPDRDRFVQIQMLSADRKSFVRVITVDLTTQRIVASEPKR